jgi:hypothetical protein
MANLSDLRQDVLPSVNDCPNIMADYAILKAVINFCNQSKAYRFSPDTIPIVSGTANYDISGLLPEGTEIASLLAAELDGAPLDIPDSGSVPQYWATELGSPSAAIVHGQTAIGLRKVPDVPGLLAVRLALRPSLSATTYPDEFHSLYRERIAAGALSSLYAQPNKPWSNAKLVADSRSMFEACILDAEFRADRGSANAPGRTSLCLIGGR